MNTSLTYEISEIFCMTYLPNYDENNEELDDELIVFNWFKDVNR